MKKVLLLLLVLLVGALGATFAGAQAACTDAIGCVELDPDEPITIAYMLTVSGSTAFLGEDSLGGIQLAIMQRGGELLGREIELVGEDSGCSAEGGQTAAQRVASDPAIIGVVGTNCSSAAFAALPILSGAGLTMISPSATNPRLTIAEEDGGGHLPGFFRTAHSDLFQGAMAAQFVYEVLGARTLATIHDGSPYADGLQGVAAEEFAELGGEVVFQGAVNVGDTDMSAILTEIASNPPDVIYFPVFEPESNFIAAQARQTPGLENVILISADGSQVSSFPGNTGNAAIGMFLTGPAVTGEAYLEFLELWADELGGVPPSGFHAHAYDATNILLDAIEAVAVELEDGTLIIGRQALRDAVAATTDFQGLTGMLSCTELGDCATGEALAVFMITEAEVVDGNWPPPLVWTLGMEEMMMP